MRAAHAASGAFSSSVIVASSVSFATMWSAPWSQRRKTSAASGSPPGPHSAGHDVAVKSYALQKLTLEVQVSSAQTPASDAVASAPPSFAGAGDAVPKELHA